ncbi:MAG: hypothetical protein HN704_11960 [Bacteroidetes bacterium]|nr:hypothetical protein [Bacteroidota bacterium]MBT7144320.1 hypothetical protein [Bacteroidota bacterium]MBT7492306.1 hypothetical protein [Bacteroidota bacterium]
MNYSFFKEQKSDSFSDSFAFEASNDNKKNEIIKSRSTQQIPEIIVEPQNQLTCIGGNISFSVSATGSAPMSFQWQFDGSNISGANDSILNINTVSFGNIGDYLCIVSNLEGADTSVIVQIDLVPLLSVLTSSYGGFEVSCVNASDGFIIINPINGTSPFNFLWSDGASDQNRTNMPAGIYTVATSDSNSCFSIETIELTAPEEINAAAVVLTNYNGYDVSCYNATDAAIGLNISGGIPPYSFSWSNGATSQNLTNVGVGTYYALISDQNNCIYDGFEGESSQTMPWNYSTTINSHAIIILSTFNVSIGGASLINGDYIGVFYDSLGTLACGGYVEWTGTSIALIAYGADAGLNSGFAMNEKFKYKIWQSTLGYIYPAKAEYDTTGIFANDSTYYDNGNSGLASLTVNDSEMFQTLAILGQPTEMFSSIEISECNGYSVCCYGDSNGFINLSPEGGISPYSYLWSNGTTTEDLNGISAGFYSVTISDQNNCTLYTDSSQMVIDSVPGWTFSNTGSNHIFLIQNSIPITIDGIQIEAGDYIGAFYFSNGSYYCGGFEEWTGNTLSVTAWGTEAGLNNGFAANEEINWIIWDASTGIECHASVSYQIAGFSHFGNFTANGISGLESLVANCVLSAETYANLTQATFINVTYTLSNYSGYSVSCPGSNDGTIDITVSGGSSPYSFLWSNGETTEDISNLNAGEYNLTITDANACTFFSDTVQAGFITLSQPDSMNITFNFSDYNGYHTSCFGNNDGAIVLSVNGGNTPYSFLWNDGETSQNRSNLTAGNYFVSVTDNNSCIVVENILLNSPDQIIASASVITDFNGYNVSCFGAEDAIVNLNVSGGISPFSFMWSNGATTQNLANIGVGTYYAIVSDANNCSFDGFIGESSQTMPWNYSSTINSHAIVILSSFNVSIGGTQISNGDYIGVFYDSLGTLACGGYVQWNGTSIALIAYGSEIGLNNGFAPYEKFQYKIWQSTLGYIYTGEAIYDLTGVFSNDSLYFDNGNSGLASLTVNDTSLFQTLVNVNQPDDLIASIEISECNGYSICCYGENTGYINITPEGGVSPYSFLWSNGATSEDISGLTAGFYFLSITDQNNCTLFSDSSQLLIDTIPNWTYFNTGSNHVILVQNSINASIDGMPVEAGDYIGVFYNSGTSLNCGGYAQWTGTTFSITAWGTEQGMNNGFAANEEIKWIIWDASTGAECQAVASYQTSGFPQLGNFTSNGISALESLSATCTQATFTYANLTQPPPIELIYSLSDFDGYSVSCYGAEDGTIDITVSGSLTPYSYLWSNGETTEDLVNIPAGVYNLTVTDANSCEFYSDSAEIIANSNISWYVNQTSANHTILIQNTINIEVNGASISSGSLIGVFYDSAGYTNCGGYIEWTGNTDAITTWGAEAGFDNGFENFEVFKWIIWDNLSGYEYYATPTYQTIGFPNQGNYVGNGISALASLITTNQVIQSDSIILTQPDAIIILSSVSDYNGFQVSCFGNNDGEINIFASNGFSPYNYLWSNGATSQNINNLNSGTYYLSVSDQHSCIQIDTFFLAEPPGIVLSANITQITNSLSSDGEIDLTITNGVSPFTFLWSNGATTEDISNLPPGTYSVSVTDNNGCIATLSTEIFAFDCSSPVWIWAKQNDGTAEDIAKSIACDDNGNVYATGHFSGTATFGGISLISTGGTDVFVAKYDSDGNTIWALQANGANNQYCEDIAIDAANNIYITGYFYNSISFDGNLLSNSGGSDIFIAKFDDQGAYQWAQKAGGSGNDISNSIAIDQSNNAYICGNFQNIANFGFSNITSNGSEDIFIAKYNSLGNLQWVIDEGGAFNDAANEITIDISNNIIVTGYFEDSISIGSTNFTSFGNKDIFIAKYHNSNTFLWAKQAGGIATDEGISISSDQSGNTYVFGHFNGTANFSGFSINSSGINDFFIAKYSTNGGIEWLKQSNSSGEISSGSIFTDNNGNSYISGSYINSFSFGNHAISGATDMDVFVSKINTAGTVLWIEEGTGQGSDIGNAICTDNSTNIFVCGEFENTLDFDTISLSSSGDKDIFISKISELELNADFDISNVSCYGIADGSIDLSVIGGTAPYSILWSNGNSSEDIDSLLPATYFVFITDSNECNIVDFTTISEPDSSYFTYTSSESICADTNSGFINISVFGGITPYSFQWSNGSTAEDLTNLFSGTYSITISDSNLCQIIDSITIVELAVPDLIVSPVDPEICLGETVNLLISGASSYLWQPSTGLNLPDIANPAANPAITTIYTITGTDSVGCSTTINLTITVNPNPAIVPISHE